MSKSIKEDIPVKPKPKWVLLQTQLDEPLAKQFASEAKARNMSKAEYLREIVTRVLK